MDVTNFFCCKKKLASWFLTSRFRNFFVFCVLLLLLLGLFVKFVALHYTQRIEMFLFHSRSFLLAVIMTLSTLLSRYVDNKIESDKKLLRQTFRNDSSILTKIDFRRPVNFLIHGWLGGLNGGYQHIPSVVKPTKGWRAQSAADRNFSAIRLFCVCMWVCMEQVAKVPTYNRTLDTKKV